MLRWPRARPRPSTRSPHRPAFAALSAVLVASCAAAPTGPVRVTSPFSAEDATVFDDGMDFVLDPSELSGRWESNWAQEMELRVRRADWVATVNVPTLRASSDAQHRRSYRLIAERLEAIVGTPPEEISLSAIEGQGAGYDSVRNHEELVLNHHFIAFVKYYRDEPTGLVLPHWHLSPASEPVTRHVLALRDRYRPTGRRSVHVHRD